MTSLQPTTTLWRPTGPKELELVRELEWRAWPPRLPEQPLFYPVLNEDYVPHESLAPRAPDVTESDFLRRDPVQQAGGRTILELWVPADELDEFNAHIVGKIELVHEYH